MKNVEGYSDPTAGEAWAHIKRDERKKRCKPVCPVNQFRREGLGLPGMQAMCRHTTRSDPRITSPAFCHTCGWG